MSRLFKEAHKSYRRPRLLSNHSSEGHALGCTGHCDGPGEASGATREFTNGVAPKIPMGHSEASQGSRLLRALCNLDRAFTGISTRVCVTVHACILGRLWGGSRAVDVFLEL